MRDTGKKPRVLIVEDDADINRLLYKILKKNGYAPEQAFSGTEARLMLQAGAYDLLLLDLMLPGMTGEELLDYIRRQKIVSGAVFLSRDGKPLSRSAIHHYVNIVSQEAKVEPEKANPRCLWKMYQNVQDGIEENIHVLIRQAYEEMMEKEQMSIGWNV